MLRYSSTFIYVALAVGLLCYLTFIDKNKPGTKEQQEAENQLFKFDPDEITKLEVTNVHGTFIFQKNNNHWEIINPVNTLADGSTVDGIISQISGAQPRQVIRVDNSETDADHLKEWGLTPPAERVVIHTKTPTYYELLIGRKVAISDNVYARASGHKNEPVRVIPDSVKQALQKDLSDFRSRNVFDFETDKVTKIATRVADTATTPGQQSEVELKDGHWTLQMPLVARASTADVQALLGKVLAEKVVDFVSDAASNLSAYGLTSPSATLSVTIKPAPDKPEEEMVLQIGGPVPDKPDQVYAQHLKSNSVFTLTKSGVDDLLKALPTVRDKHVLPFDPGKVTHAAYSLLTKRADLASAKGLWSTVGENEGRADIGKVNDLISKLSQLETTPVLKDSATDLKPFGLDKPIGKITLQSPEFKPGPSLSLLIGLGADKLLYVRNSSEPFIYTLPPTALDFLPTDNLALRDARVIDLQLKDVKGMTVTEAPTAPATQPVTLTLVRSAGGTWTATNVKERMVDSLMADRQASLVCQLQAKSWLGPVLPAYALGKPVLTISIETDKPHATVLRIGAKLPDGGYAASVEGEPTAFDLADGDYSILNSSSLQLLPAVLSGTNAPPVTPATNAAPEKK